MESNYSVSDLSGAGREKTINDRNLMFMTEAARLKYWRVKSNDFETDKKEGSNNKNYA